MTFFDCTADLVGQLNGNGQKGMLQIDAPRVENLWLSALAVMLVWFVYATKSQRAAAESMEL